MMMRIAVLAAILAGSVSATATVTAAKAATSAAKPAATRTAAATAPTVFDQICERLLPPEKVNAAVGFFAPVAKKYMPEFESFSAAYETAADKTAVVARYLPTADKAMAEARAMSVPAKYEQEKARYLQIFDAALVAAKMYVKLGQLKGM